MAGTAERFGGAVLCVPWCDGRATDDVTVGDFPARGISARLGSLSSAETRVSAVGTCLHREPNAVLQAPALQIFFWDSDPPKSSQAF